MKKVLSILAVSAFALGMASCKKSGECTCEIDVLGETQTTVTPYEDLDKDAYEAAQDACDAANTGAQAAGGSCTWMDT